MICKCCGKKTDYLVVPKCYIKCNCKLEDMDKCIYKRICHNCFMNNETDKCKYRCEEYEKKDR
jgi:hypothetical protein